MRLVFLGSGAFGIPTLKALAAAHDVALVVTQPDRAAGRGRACTPTPVAELAQSLSLRTLKPADANVDSVVQTITEVAADALVVIAFGQKLGPDLLRGKFAINLHASLLPKYRGAAPINWAMINGETETGLSVIAVANRMDAGDIFAQESTPIDPMETAGELHDRLALMGPPLIDQVLHGFEAKRLHPVPQLERLATRAPKLSKRDGAVSFDQPALNVRQRVHGLTPWPGCTIQLDGRPLRIARVQTVEHHATYDDPGMVLSDYTIACSPGSIRFLEVQPPGGRLMSFEAYRNGQPVRPGMRCISA